ncbi:uncharacterized protein LOC124870466 isoform X2 [Girardinichthys multiradiatus]|uniref:uncharacterized protein LOC124870466 isoform X2 n=1 Tax=Girardinichthys multiradiatus TaxID=208333 RepID=UPI001FAC710E|nr:uncharacterized protein LOC124870466 isoform X2 [Girardinichthys multiradiatus]
MAAVILRLFVSLLGSVEGSDLRFVAYGSDLLLDVNKAAVGTEDDFNWRFNNTDNIVKYNYGSNPRVSTKYKHRANFFAENFFLLLRNMQHNDSGNYKAVAIGLEQETTLAEYTVRVQDRVSPVKLTITPNDPSFCNFTTTCRTVDSLINGTFHCVNQICHLLKQTDLKDSSLMVYVDEGSIICNHSNHVNWEQDAKAVESLCEKETAHNRTTAIVSIVRITLVALLVVVGTLTVSILTCKKKSKLLETVYEVPPPQPGNGITEDFL